MKQCYHLILLSLLPILSFAQNASPVLKRVFTAPDSGYIVDYAYKKAFSYVQNGAGYTYSLTNISSGAVTIIPFTKKLQQDFTYASQKGSAWVTPSGVVFIGQSPANNAVWALYEWSQGTLTVLAENMGGISVAGNYVSWLVNDTAHSGYLRLIRHNTATHQQITVADTLIREAAVGPNGNTAFTDGQGVYFCRDSSCRMVDYVDTASYPYAGLYFNTVRTDGEKVTYAEYYQEPAGVNWGSRMHVFENDSAKVLYEQADLFEYSTYSSNLAPLMNNGYIAGQQLLGNTFYFFRTKLFSRNPQGNLHFIQDTYTYMPPWGLVSLNALTPYGDIGGFTSASTGHTTQIQYFYYINHDGTKKRLLSESGSYLFYEEQDSTWLIAEDAGLYAANLDTTYDHHIEPFTKQAYTNTRTPITGADFVQHYSGPATTRGQITKIEILQSPRHGVLLNKDDQPVFVGRNNVISRASLDTLKYSAGSFPGRDTIRYRAFDGLTWTNDTVFYMNIVPNPGTVTPFERTTLAGTPIRFWGSNFKQHYSGQLAGIKVTRLPVYGRLTIGGKQLFYERSADVTLAELDSMYYTPNPGIVGIDTLQWKGYNGTSYTANAAPAILRVYPQLNTPPILRTLESSYNRSAPPDTILIANYPAPNWHTDVMVVADGTQVLPVSAGHTFTIDPAAFSPGAHQLKVAFSNPRDSISILRSFTITGNLAPLMLAAGGTTGIGQAGALQMAANDKYGTAGAGPVNAWPNPFNQQFTLNGLSANSIYMLTLFDQQGKMVLQQRVVNQSKVVLNIGPHTGKGMYLLQIITTGKKDEMKKIKLLHL